MIPNEACWAMEYSYSTYFSDSPQFFMGIETALVEPYINRRCLFNKTYYSVSSCSLLFHFLWSPEGTIYTRFMPVSSSDFNVYRQNFTSYYKNPYSYYLGGLVEGAWFKWNIIHEIKAKFSVQSSWWLKNCQMAFLCVYTQKFLC